MGAATGSPVPIAPVVGDRPRARRQAGARRAEERARLRVVLATIVLNLVLVTALTLAPSAGWRSGLVVALIDTAVLAGFAAWRRDALIARLLAFGLVVGLAELAADAWLVDATGTLSYRTGGGPHLWASPVWMPLAWATVAAQTGYVGNRLVDRFGAAGLLLSGLLGALYIPFYEEMARHIHWWSYGGAHMLSNSPYFIVAGEFLIAIALVLLARPLRRSGFGAAAWLGLAGGAAILACYAIAFLVLEGSLPR